MILKFPLDLLCERMRYRENDLLSDNLICGDANAMERKEANNTRKLLFMT